MTKLRHYTVWLIAPVFLFHTLSLKAQTTTQSPATTSRPTACNTLKEQTTGVKKRLYEYRKLVSGRQCIVLTANPADDLSELIQQIPENTVILLSSNTTAPTAAHATRIIPVKYFIGSEIVLKDGHDILGAADDGFIIVITFHSNYQKKDMIKAGTTDNFQFEKTRDSHIEHITFLSTGPKHHRPVNTIVFAECYNRRLIVQNNVFFLPEWAAVYIDCKEPLNASANATRPGPGLLFANNTLRVDTISAMHHGTIPDEGVYINLPNIMNHSERVAVIGNLFMGAMADAGEFNLGPRASMDVFRNTLLIYIAEQPQRGFVLTGYADTDAERPLFNLAANEIYITGTAITVSTPLALALACNKLEAVNPWQQLQPQFILKAVDPLPLARECESFFNSTGHIMNTWTAINGSTATASSGLINVEGQFLFESNSSQTATGSPTAITDTPAINGTFATSSEVTTLVTTGLAVITTLAILSAL
ncbi:hypothetical protein [Endozoicomonas sp. 4G]|uniref:hypothetical protein n=1 Tax=Endozoicomonas sp. 4G TaxID=2872754 RepID=UPI002078ED67|nr:hypothetical protein [Endozoicomonas sp. 4G]